MECNELYCTNCKKPLGRYNTKYFSALKLNEIIMKNNMECIRQGHQISIRRITVD